MAPDLMQEFVRRDNPKSGLHAGFFRNRGQVWLIKTCLIEPWTI
jgi:hypothetical protein